MTQASAFGPRFAPPPAPAPAPGTPAKPKRKKGTSPTARSLAELRKLGFTAHVVERFNVYSKVTVDLFNCIDIVAMRSGSGIFGIQATSGSNHAARRMKSLAEPKLRTWLECGARFEIWSWSMTGERGARKLWTLRREEITLPDVAA